MFCDCVMYQMPRKYGGGSRAMNRSRPLVERNAVPPSPGTKIAVDLECLHLNSSQPPKLLKKKRVRREVPTSSSGSNFLDVNNENANDGYGDENSSPSLLRRQGVTVLARQGTTDSGVGGESSSCVSATPSPQLDFLNDVIVNTRPDYNRCFSERFGKRPRVEADESSQDSVDSGFSRSQPSSSCESTSDSSDSSQPSLLKSEADGKGFFIDIDEFLRFIDATATERPRISVIDCRYPYEFNGGHITHPYVETINCQDVSELTPRFFAPRELGPDTRRHIIVFHCEFSSQRGPKMYSAFREADRNRSTYPDLHYPELYILKNGYAKFYEHCSGNNRLDLCNGGAGGYTLMHDPRFTQECHANESRRRLMKSQSCMQLSSDTSAPPSRRPIRAQTRRVLTMAAEEESPLGLDSPLGLAAGASQYSVQNPPPKGTIARFARK